MSNCYHWNCGGIFVTRSFILIILIIGVTLIVSCSGSPTQPTATIQPTTAPAQSTATPMPTTAPVQPTATVQPTLTLTRPTATTQPTPTLAQPTATVQPTKSPAQPTAAVQPTAPSSSSGQPKLNLDDYLPKGVGRDLLLRDCTSCHSFVPIVTGQRPNDRWSSLKSDHKDKASSVSESDYNTVFAYLIENFNNTKPEPKFPDWFVQQQIGIGE